MAIPDRIRVLFFDVFGTCVQQRPPVADELHNAAKEALHSGSSPLSSEVREKAMKMVDIPDLAHASAIPDPLTTICRLTKTGSTLVGCTWDRKVERYVKTSITKSDTVDWLAVDKYRLDALGHLLAERGLIILRHHLDDDTDTSTVLDVEPGSLWSTATLQHLCGIWHRLPPWPDTIRGLTLLNQKYTTATLSNTYNELMQSLVAHSQLPFQHVLTSDLFGSYKPNPQVYLSAAARLGVQPEECALVAAHLGDLKGAKANGFFACYVQRPLEEKAPALVAERIPDLVIEEAEEGFVALAKRFGIQDLC